MNKDHIDYLKDMGFTATESRAYLALLESGKSLAGAIAVKSGLYRKNAYDALESLSSKGFVTKHVQNHKSYWEVISPEKIRSLLKEKLNYTSEIMPQLLLKFHNIETKQSVEIFQGIEGIKSFNNFMLREGKTIYNIGATGVIFKKLKYSIPNYLEELYQKDIKINYLISSDADVTGIKKLQKIKNINIRKLPKNFKTPAQINIFGDYAGIWIWSEEPLAILIKSKEIAAGFKKYFDFMWDISQTI